MWYFGIRIAFWNLAPPYLRTLHFASIAFSIPVPQYTPLHLPTVPHLFCQLHTCSIISPPVPSPPHLFRELPDVCQRRLVQLPESAAGQADVVEQRLWEHAPPQVRLHRGVAVPLAQLGAVRVGDQRQMSELRRLPAQRAAGGGSDSQ